MGPAYQRTCERLREHPRRWLVTGCAGFIGSHLLESLLQLDQEAVGLDDFSLGRRANLVDVESKVGRRRWERFRMVEASICSTEACAKACAGTDVVLHQAAIGSVPRSIEDPLASHHANLTGFITLFEAARAAGVRQIVYASSSSVYGDSPASPKREEQLGRPLSPYAVTKRAGELYAAAAAAVHGTSSIGLRYFNVFGPRQDPSGAYAAVIPRWIDAMIAGAPVYVNGTGETSRDFCYVANVVQANLLAGAREPAGAGHIFNVAVGKETTLNALFGLLRERLARWRPSLTTSQPLHRDFRPGDVRHSLADIGRASETLGYQPTHDLEDGLDETLDWYRADGGESRAPDAGNRTDPSRHECGP